MDDNMFTPVIARAASTFKRVNIEASVDAADPHKLVVPLFEALLQSLGAALSALARGDIAAKGAAIIKAVRILQEGLEAGLNDAEGRQVAANLRGVYSYSISRLTQAKLRNHDARIAEVVALLEPIDQAWAQIRGAISSASGART